MKIDNDNAMPELEFKNPPHVLILEARFYDHVNDKLVEGAKNVLENYGATYEVVTVPGALEIPVAIKFLAERKQGKRFDAFVALGCVIRGETSHYDTVCNESARGLTDIAIKLDLAVGNGIITVENEAQAIARADSKQMNKGGAAAVTALSMLKIKQACL